MLYSHRFYYLWKNQSVNDATSNLDIVSDGINDVATI